MHNSTNKLFVEFDIQGLEKKVVHKKRSETQAGKTGCFCEQSVLYPLCTHIHMLKVVGKILFWLFQAITERIYY